MPIIDLVTLDEWDSSAAETWSFLDRVEFSSHIVGWVVLVVGLMTPWRATGSEFWRGLMYSVAIGTTFGLLTAVVGALMDRTTGSGRKRLRKRLSPIFDGSSTILAPPPPGATHRLPCSIRLASGDSLGGVLYVITDRLRFQSHLIRYRTGLFRPGRSPESLGVEFGPPGSIILQTGSVPRTGWLSRIRKLEPLPALLCSSAQGEAVFLVPAMAVAIPRLQHCIDSIRNPAPSSA